MLQRRSREIVNNPTTSDRNVTNPTGGRMFRTRLAASETSLAHLVPMCRRLFGVLCRGVGWRRDGLVGSGFGVGSMGVGAVKWGPLRWALSVLVVCRS